MRAAGQVAGTGAANVSLVVLGIGVPFKVGGVDTRLGVDCSANTKSCKAGRTKEVPLIVPEDGISRKRVSSSPTYLSAIPKGMSNLSLSSSSTPFRDLHPL